jgi:LmbE family N-acetylglucosaminyl deacetylase
MVEPKLYQRIPNFNSCAVVVAHPDDETLWAGGTMLTHPEVKWTVVTLCRGSDQDRSSRFFRALENFNATGIMGDLGDGPKQPPLINCEVQNAILSLLSSNKFDIIVTHSVLGEYTRHLRHEETGKAVLTLCRGGKLSASAVWAFAYEDGGGKHLPRAVQDADIRIRLPKEIWQKKYDIITETYGFDCQSFEAKTTPREEAFWCFGAGDNFQKRLKNRS